MISRLSMTNWLCYAGENVLDLGPTVYGITASTQEDPERSNWVGKTSLAAAIPYALFDHHKKRFDDDVITNGQDQVTVSLTLREDLTVERSKRRGRPSVLKVWTPGGEAKGEEAQKLIVEMVGLSKEDFFWSSYFEQKQMARFVRSEPSKRILVVGEWFRFGEVREGEKRVRERLSAAIDAADAVRSEAAGPVATLFPDGNVGDAGEVLAKAGEALALADLAAAEADSALEAARRAYEEKVGSSSGKRDLARYMELVAEGKVIGEAVASRSKEAIDKEVASTTEGRDRAVAASRATLGELGKVQRMSAGHASFDGCCPVSGRECPVREEINRDKEQLAGKAAKLEVDAASSRKAVEAASQKHSAAVAWRQKHEQEVERLDLLRKEARRLKASASAAASLPEAEGTDAGSPTLEEASRRAVRDRAAVEVARARLVAVTSAVAKLSGLSKKLKEVEARVEVLREAASIFGTGGAQRRIAEGNLLQIEAAANAKLAGCGIGLTVGVTWSREGKDLSAACQDCGRTFPRGKAKVCDRCGAPRGNSVQHRLDVHTSRESGAAEDLAGMAFQLAAAEWLRRDRSAGWDVLVVDEPFGALDLSHRKTLRGYLATMILGGSAWSQGFVIAHNQDAMDALPGRIEVVGRPDGTAFARVA